MESSTSIATACRNLAQRLEPFLAARRETILTAGEATNIAAALACLESGRYADGEDAMMLAEKDWPPRGELGTAIPLEVAGRAAWRAVAGMSSALRCGGSHGAIPQRYSESLGISAV